MDEMLFRVLAEAVGRYLDAAESRAGATSGMDTLRLVAAWRALLREHGLSGHRCRVCKRKDGLCGVWRVAVDYFVHRLQGGGPSRLRARGDSSSRSSG